MNAPVVQAPRRQPDLGETRVAEVILNVRRGEVILDDGTHVIGYGRWGWPTHGKLQGEDVGVVTHQVHSDGALEGGYHRIGLLETYLHCGRALVCGTQKDEFIAAGAGLEANRLGGCCNWGERLRLGYGDR